MSKLVLILCSPRTGSSIVSQIFWRHGCWVSKKTAKFVNRFGYTTYEDRSIRTVVKNQWHYYNKYLAKQKIKKIKGAPIKPRDEYIINIKTVVDRTIPKDVDYWMFKTSVETYPLFVQFDPIFVFVERDEDQATESMHEKQRVRGRVTQKSEIREIYQRRMDTMSDIKDECGGEWVNTDELMSGNYKSIQRAVEYSGLDYDPELVDASIHKKKWHYRK